MELTNLEINKLNNISNIINLLKNNLLNNKFDNNNLNLEYWYNYLNNIKDIIGNFNEKLSFISCLLAKKYLMEIYKIENFDVALKSQSATGLDIDINTIDGKRIIAEIKTTNALNENNLGAKQKESICEDLNKLKNKVADYKYLFLTEVNTYNIVKRNYEEKYKDIKIIILK
jgi:hypothetical protein